MMVEKKTSLPRLIIIKNSEWYIVCVVVEIGKEPECPQELFGKSVVNRVIQQSYYYYILT